MAALDCGIELQIPISGWIPHGRLTEAGPLDPKYPLKETESADYPERTRLNCRDSDATLILSWGKPSGGTALTVTTCQKLQKPYFVVEFADDRDPLLHVDQARRWLEGLAGDVTLNVAGSRASKAPKVYHYARVFLRAVLAPGQPVTLGDLSALSANALQSLFTSFFEASGAYASDEEKQIARELVRRARRLEQLEREARR